MNLTHIRTTGNGLTLHKQVNIFRGIASLSRALVQRVAHGPLSRATTPATLKR